MSAQAPILSAFDWQVHGLGGERHLRAGFLDAPNSGKLQFRYEDPAGLVTWVDLVQGLNSVNFNFAQWFNDAEDQSLLLFVNGQSGIYEWDGALANFASSSNTYGAIATIGIPNNAPNTLFTGGSGYTFGELLNVTTGNGDAIVSVQTLINNAIITFHIGGTGSGYTTTGNNQISISIGGPSDLPATFLITSVNGGGGITGLTLQDPGSNFVATTTYNATGGTGSGASITVDSVSGLNTIRTIAIENAGSGYSVSNNNPTTPTSIGSGGTGALVDILSLYNTAITVQGSLPLTVLNFYSDVNDIQKFIIINGVNYSYQTVQNLTFIGVSPDPTLTSFEVGDLIFQAPKVTSNINMKGIPPDFKNQLIATLNQHVFIGSVTSNLLYFSTTSSYTDFTFNNPRLFGDGGQLALDSAAVALIAQEGDLYTSAGLSEWYQIVFTPGQDSFGDPTELVSIARLETAANQGTQTQALTGKIANNVMFVSNEKIAMTLGRVANVVVTPQLTDLSYSIVNDMNAYDFTDGCIFYFQKFIYVAIPKQSVVRIYNMTNEDKKGSFYWEAPQIMPISRFSIIDGELYGHSYQVSETYKLFTGYNDNGHAITAIAIFSFQQDGTRSASKSFNEFYSEGYISANTVLTNGFNFDTDGNQTTTTFPINGSDTQIVGIKQSPASLGKSSLGKNPLGGDIDVTNNPMPPKFRVIKTFPRIPYYEYQPFYKSQGIDQQWELIAFGAATSPTTEDNSAITE